MSAMVTSKLEILDAADIPALVELEEILFPGDSPWTQQMFDSELAAGHHYVVHRDADGLIDGYAGLARTVVSRTSGTRLNIWFTEEAPQFKGVAGADAKAWAVECEDHGKSKLCDTRTEARLHREDPASFCPTCKAASKRTSKKAA